jgi:hypothetical protein
MAASGDQRACLAAFNIDRNSLSQKGFTSGRSFIETRVNPRLINYFYDYLIGSSSIVIGLWQSWEDSSFAVSETNDLSVPFGPALNVDRVSVEDELSGLAVG